MEINLRERFIRLYNVYKNLLTTKQRDYFEEYYLYDYSLSEIAQNHNVSRNACFDAIKKCENLLNDYEAKLHLDSIYTTLEEVYSSDNIDEIKNKIKNIIEV